MVREKSVELLAPAGSFESMKAAVAAGADAVYMGGSRFGARAYADNPDKDKLLEAIDYVHIHGRRLYMTVNTLFKEKELGELYDYLLPYYEQGVDGVIVQDLGAFMKIREWFPELPIHASTQMTVTGAYGAKVLKNLGAQRVVTARELSLEEIREIHRQVPIEIESFVHGALCYCYSGQCLMSSLIGGRSGNRGMCAQPCRLPYGWGDLADGYPLSLKDMSLAGHLKELQDMGVASAKIEGRMKRPEYVYIVTKVYADALREGREPTADELRRLEQAFSRQGFTDGYYLGQTGPDMFGVREEVKPPRELFSHARAAYEKGEGPGVPVKFYAMIRPGEPIQVGVEDGQGRVATAAGKIPEPARRRPTSQEEVEAQLGKTGGTPFIAAGMRTLVEGGLNVPLSAVNALRRQVLDELSKQRTALPRRRHGEFKVGARYENRREEPELYVSLRHAGQLTFELVKAKPALITLPADEIAAHPDDVKGAIQRGVPVAAVLPRICFDRELPRLREDLAACREIGVTDVYVGNLGLVPLCKELGFNLRGDFGLQVFNSQGLKEYKRLGFQSLTASFELKLAQIRDLSKAVDTEIIGYGRLPLMITENCAVKNQSGQCTCGNVNQLIDRKGFRFPVEKAWGCRNELLNANKIFLADKAEDWKKAGLRAVRLLFTTENGVECTQVLDAYRGTGAYRPNNFTRGLYYRDVE